MYTWIIDLEVDHFAGAMPCARDGMFIQTWSNQAVVRQFEVGISAVVLVLLFRKHAHASMKHGTRHVRPDGHKLDLVAREFQFETIANGSAEVQTPSNNDNDN